MRTIRLLQVVLTAGLAAQMWAQSPDAEGAGRGVARISLMNGDVSVRRGDSGDLIAAGVNAPLVVQDRVLTGPGSRAEVQFDWANFLRIAANADVRLAELEHRRYLVQVARGTVTWRVLRDSDAYVEVSTPSVSVRPVRKGTYRVTVVEDGTSEITVRSGEAEVFTPRGSERVRSGRTMAVRGTAADPEFRVIAEIPDDDWDRWNVMRDRDLERSRSYQYMSRDIYGAEDLDAHGRWVNVPSYGWVWSPRVAVGWAPYRYGRWAWIDWYGWSWVSYDPWGWAPYHYGRWFNHGPYGWCWWPGPVSSRYYWSPGLVAFFGFGNVGVGLGWGRIGWVPLAPWERYSPWYGRRWYGGYGRSGYGYNNLTVVNNVNITNVYRNARGNHGLTVVDQDGFRRGRLGEAVRINSDELRSVSMAQGPVPVTPERSSLRFADREATVRAAAGREPERFFSNRQPAPVQRVSFDEQRRGLEQMTRAAAPPAAQGTTGGRGSRGLEEQRGSRAAEPAAATAPRTDEQRGWRRLGESPRNAETVRSAESDRSGARSAESELRRSPDSLRSAEPARVSGSERSETRSADTEWRRFGSARVSDGNQIGRSEAGGRSFGEPAAPRSEVSPRGSSDSWRRFEGSAPTGRTDWSGGSRAETSGTLDSAWRRGSGESGRGVSEAPRSSGRDWSDMQRSEPRGSMGRGDFGGSRSSGESIRISPPIVRERGGDFGGMRGSSSGGGRSMDAPRSSPSGGDGGGMRGGGGGGGRGGDSGGARGGGGRSR